MANQKHDHQFPRYFQSVTNLSLNERNNDIKENYPIFSVCFVGVTTRVQVLSAVVVVFFSVTLPLILI